MNRRLCVIALLATLAACQQKPKAEATASKAPVQHGVVQGADAQGAFDQIPLNRASDQADATTDTASAEDDADLSEDATANADEPPTDTELSGERVAQRSLPMVRGGQWQVLRKSRIHIDEVSQFYVATHPPEVRALAGKPITLRGYMLPLESTARTRHFLISPYTPVCLFHPPAEPNEVVEVHLSRPIDGGYHLVEVTGVLRIENNGEKGLFFAIDRGQGRIVQRIE